MARLRRIGRELLVFAFFVVATLALTWPLARNFSTAVTAAGDPYVSISIFDWTWWATFHRPLELFHQPIFHPARYTLAFTEHLFGIALVAFPFYALGASSITAYNATLILGFAFCGYSAYVLGRLVTGSMAASIAGGIFFAFMPYRITQNPHISYVWAGWLPLLIAALLWWGRRPGWKRAALVGLVFFVNGLTCATWLAMAGVAAGFTILLLWILRGLKIREAFEPIASLAIASLALLPWYLPYLKVRTIYGMVRRPEEVEYFSATPRHWLIGGDHLFYGRFLNDLSENPELWLFTGFVPLILAAIGWGWVTKRDEEIPEAPVSPRILRLLKIAIVIAGLWTLFEIAAAQTFPLILGNTRLSFGGNSLAPMLFALLLATRLAVKVRTAGYNTALAAALLWLTVGFLGSLGFNGFLHQFLYDYVPPFQSIRVAARWAMIAYVGLAALVSCGAMIAINTTTRFRRAISIAIPAVLLMELNPAPVSWYLTPERPPVYRWLRQLPVHGAILELPLATYTSEYEYLYQARAHGRRMLNGVSSYIPRHFDQLVEMAHANPVDRRLLDRLERTGCAFIVVHADRFYGRDEPTRRWLREGIQTGRLSFIRRFPHYLQGDYVFAVNRVAPRAAFYRQPDVADRSGLRPSDHLERFLDRNAITYFDQPIALLDVPTGGAPVRGGVIISGWAASPNGVKEVNLLFRNAAVKLETELIARPELGPELIGYPTGSATGFRRKFSKRPLFAKERTDLIVEVVDRSGSTRRLEPTLITWRNRDDIRPEDWQKGALAGLLRRLGEERDLDREYVSIREITFTMLQKTRDFDDTRFVRSCYRVFLNRGADAPGLERHLASLRQGKSRRDVVRTFIRSEEFQQKHLQCVFR